MAGQIAPPFGHCLHGSDARLAAAPRRDSGTGHHHTMRFNFLCRTPEALGHELAENHLCHGAAAGVPGADKQKHEAGEPAQRLLRHDPRMHHLKIVFTDGDRRGGVRIASTAVVEHQGERGADPGDHVLRRGGQLPRPAHFGQGHRPRQHAHAIGHHLVAGNTHANAPAIDQRQA